MENKLTLIKKKCDGCHKDVLCASPQTTNGDTSLCKICLSSNLKEFDYTPPEKIDYVSEEVGFFDLGKGRKIIEHLYAGHDLEMSHGVYGKFGVKMNPQRNRILVSPDHERVNEESILWFIFNYPSDWFILKK